MKQFYETYCNNEIVSPLVTQFSWTNNLMILSKAKNIEEKEFYIKLSIKERLTKRELEKNLQIVYMKELCLRKRIPLII